MDSCNMRTLNRNLHFSGNSKIPYAKHIAVSEELISGLGAGQGGGPCLLGE